MPSLEITTMVGCPLRCTYCPQDALKESYGRRVKYLSLVDFKTIVGKVPRYVRIDFSGMSEPWANSQATAMLRHTLEGGYHVAIYTTLFGMVDFEDVLDLLRRYDKQVEVICLHLPDRFGNMRGFKASKRYKDALRAFIAEYYDGEVAHQKFQIMTMDHAGGVDPALRDIMQWVIDDGWVGNRRAGNVEETSLSAPSIEARIVHHSPVSCSYTPFYDQNVVLPNGDVVLCCMDYSSRHKLGNLLTGDYWSLFSSEAMTALKLANLKPDCGSLCKTCSRAVTYGLQEHTYHAWEPKLPADSLMKEPQPT